MILVTLNEADFEYDIHSLVKAFFPKEEVSVSAERMVSEEEPLFHMDIIYEHGLQQDAGHGMILFFIDGGKQAEVSVDYRDRIETKNRLKQTLYRVLTAYTGSTLPWGSLTGIRPTKIPMAFLEERRSREWIRDYMRDTYYASEEKIGLSIEIAERELALLKKLDYECGYSLYIGIPFCPSTCLYCSFTSYPLGKWAPRVDEYQEALEKEINFVAEALRDRHLNTIYIGGGTPTTLTAEQLDRLFTKLEEHFDFSHLMEYTVEAGRPDSITREKLLVLRKHGISRISINPQTMKQETLDLIGRRHTVAQTKECFYLARELGFDNINMDLIIGLPEEGISEVRDTMEQLMDLDPDSVTVHSLALKRAARLSMFKEDYQELQMINTPEMIGLTAEYAKKMGLVPYYLYRQKNMAGNFENVGYAKPGKEGLYNILMMEEKQDILALGAGSVSKRLFEGGRIERCENVKEVAQYIGRIDEMIERKRNLWH